MEDHENISVYSTNLYILHVQFLYWDLEAFKRSKTHFGIDFMTCHYLKT